MRTTQAVLTNPACIALYGPSRSGKTSLTLSLIRHAKDVFSTPFQHHVWCLPSGSEPPDEIAARSDFQIHFGVPDGAELPPHSLVVLDDLQHENNIKTQLLHTVHSHHRSLTVISLNHNLFPKNRFHRDMTQSTQYVIILANPRDAQAFHRLALQLEPSRARSLYESYLDACGRPYGYLLCDLTQQAHPALRYRTQILPTDDGLHLYTTDEHLNQLMRDDPSYVRYTPSECATDPSALEGRPEAETAHFDLPDAPSSGQPV